MAVEGNPRRKWKDGWHQTEINRNPYPMSKKPPPSKPPLHLDSPPPRNQQHPATIEQCLYKVARDALWERKIE